MIAAWTGGATYVLLFGNDPPSGVRARTCVAVLLCLSLAVPLSLSGNLQTFSTRKGLGRFTEFGSVPSCLVKASLYIREHSHPDDIVQDSQNDSNVLVSGLSERQAYAISYMFDTRRSGEMVVRLNELAALRKMSIAADVTEFARRRHISWYVLRPGSEVAWPGSVLDNSAFNCDGYRVYRFAESVAATR